MSHLFKLDINEYTIGEMRQLLNLRVPYTIKDIMNSEDTLREKLMQDDSVSLTKKEKIITFLSKVKAELVANSKPAIPTAAIFEDEEHNVIRLPQTPHERNSVESYVNPRFEAAAANMEAWHRKRYLLCLDSRFRDNYYTTLSTNYRITLPTELKNVVSLELQALEFPSTYYQISKSLGNNFFWLGWSAVLVTTNPPVGPTPTLLNWFYIAVPDGNYKRNEIQDALNEQITYATQKGLIATEGGPQLDLNGRHPPQCTIDSHSTKTIFAVSSAKYPQLIQVRFNGARSGNTSTSTTPRTTEPPLDLTGAGGIISNLGWILGYRMADYNGSQAYVSEGCYDAWGTKYFYIVVNDYNSAVTNFVIPVYNSSIGKANILARVATIAATSSSFSEGLNLNTGNVSESDSLKKRNYFGPVNIKRLQIQVLDEFGRIMDLNNMDFSMAIDCVYLYD